MKKFIVSNLNITATNFPVTDYSNETVWGKPSSFFRRIENGYEYSTSGNNENPPKIEGFQHGLNPNDITNFSRYSAVVSHEAFSGDLQSTADNTFITNDGIVVVCLSNSVAIIYDLLAKEDETHNYEEVKESDEFQIKQDFDIFNAPDTSLAFIGYPNNGILEYKPEIVFKTLENSHFHSNCAYDLNSANLAFNGGISYDEYGLFQKASAPANTSTIYLKPKQTYSIRNLSENAVINLEEGSLYEVNSKIIRLRANNQLPNNSVKVSISSTQKEYFTIS